MIGSGTKAGFELDGAHRLGEAELGCKHTYFLKASLELALSSRLRTWRRKSAH